MRTPFFRKKVTPHVSTAILRLVKNCIYLVTTYYCASRLDWENCEIPVETCITER